MTHASPTLDLLTWNIAGLDSRRLDSRIEKICAQVLLGQSVRDAMKPGRARAPMPHVVCFQEVVSRSFAVLKAHFSAAGYSVFPSIPPDREDYCVIAVRPPWRATNFTVTPFEHSPLARALYQVELEHDALLAPLVVATMHMESLRSGSEARLDQALEISRLVQDGIAAGDTNLRAGEAKKLESMTIESQSTENQSAFTLSDAWTHWCEGDPKVRKSDGHTWSTSSIEGLTAPTKRFRFDRIWFSEKRAHLLDMRIRRLSKLSDHAALQARFVVQ